MSIEPRRLPRNCDVTALLILYGLPRLLSGTHHCSRDDAGLPKFKLNVEEGICLVLAYMWLESEIIAGSDIEAVSSVSSSSASSGSQPSLSGFSKKGKRSEFEKKLGELFKHQIESDRLKCMDMELRQWRNMVSSGLNITFV